MKKFLLVMMTLLVAGFWSCESTSAGEVIAWGRNDCGQCDVPDGNSFVAVSAGAFHGLALRSNGTLVAWGDNSAGQCDVPVGNDFVAVAAGGLHSLALRSDGSIVGWGLKKDGLTSKPISYDFVAIAAGFRHNLALKSDGSLVAWGANNAGQLDVPDGNEFIAIAAGWFYNLALKSDGSIAAWGSNDAGQCNVPDGNDFIAIAAGGKHGVALKADRSVVSWGAIEAKVVRPPSQDFKAIAAGNEHCLALQCHGSVIGWGSSEDGQIDVPTHIDSTRSNFVAISGGYGFSLAIHRPTLRPETEWYVSANGSPCGDGSQENPWDLTTALWSTLVEPGHTVWIADGTYHGPFEKPAIPSGTENAPIIYRAMPGHRVTLTANRTDQIVLKNYGSYVWFWGFEVTIDGAVELGLWGNAVKQETGTESKYINMIVHDCPNRSGFFIAGIGAELYGCLSYRNGQWANGYSHGFYCQNSPDNAGVSVEDLPWMNLLDCLAFENYGWGIHSYAEGPSLANMLYEGVVAYGNHVGNFISGGEQYDDNFIVRNCWTYFPDGERLNAEFGYNSPLNGTLTIENNVFVGGSSTVWFDNWQHLMFQNNTCYTNDGWLLTMNTPDTAFQYILDNNKYYLGSSRLAYLDGTSYHTLDAWQTEISYDQNSTNTVEAPTDLWVFIQPNKYEPDRAHLIVYNWPKTETVSINLAKLWKVKKAQQYQYRIVNVEDIWGQPVAEGKLDDTPVELRITGPYAPEFACYLVTRRIP
ncbi:MAG: RCC1 domain-containing protein [Phycisphaerae bacterium]